MSAEVGAKIKLAMERRMMRREHLALVTGKAAGTIYQWELGIRKPSILDLAQVARALDVSTDWLLGITDEEPHWDQHTKSPQHPEVPEGYAERERRERNERRKQSAELLDVGLDTSKKRPNE